MQRYSKLLGLPVFYENSPSRLGNVIDVVFMPEQKRISKILIGNRGFMRSCFFTMFDEIRSIGLDAVILKENAGRQGLAHNKGKDNIRKLILSRVLTRDGQNIGILQDVFFDDMTGKLEAVQISDGIIMDIVSGRQVIPLLGRVEFGEEFMFLDKEAYEEGFHDGGGIKSILRKGNIE